MHPRQRIPDAPRPSQPDGLGGYVERIADDLKTIARDEVELVRGELEHMVKLSAAEAAGVLVAALVALIGFCMLCVAGVVALAPVIPSLALRLVLMSLIFLAGGGGIAAYFIKQLGKDLKPDLDEVVHEAKQTKNAVADTIATDEATPHA
jgi:TRAP-type C4-dicarboxylate transport system permease small subunit